MEFIVDGTRFDITAEDVRAQLLGRSPEKLYQYTVAIDGTSWPVKQVFSLATGLSHERFVSQTARRQLRKLGFMIDEEPTRLAQSESRPLGVRSAPLRRSTFDPTGLVESDTVTTSLNFTWMSTGTIHLDEAGKPVFPPLPKAPGLYRFTFSPTNDSTMTTVYIGESVDLSRRSNNYRNATRDDSSARTSRRIHKELSRHINGGGQVEFSIATEVLLGIDGDQSDLRRSSARRLAENAGVLLSQLNAIPFN